MSDGSESPAVRVAFLRLDAAGDLPIPRPMTPHAAGMDIAAAVAEAVTLDPGARLSIPTGFALAIPEGYEGQVRPRSGLAANHGVTVLNAPGTIDADYRGELRVLLVNLGAAPFVIERGMRIAQLVIAPLARSVTVEVQDLPASSRGSGGFGSTGVA